MNYNSVIEVTNTGFDRNALLIAILIIFLSIIIYNVIMIILSKRKLAKMEEAVKLIKQGRARKMRAEENERLRAQGRQPRLLINDDFEETEYTSRI